MKTIITDKDYSNYIEHKSNIVNVSALFAGFTFTIITLLLTQLPPDFLQNNFFVQITLFFLTILFEIWSLLIGWTISDIINFCKHVPYDGPEYKHSYNLDILLWLGSALFGVPILLMYLIWGLIILALAAAISWVIYIILSTAIILRLSLKSVEIRKKRFGIE